MEFLRLTLKMVYYKKVENIKLGKKMEVLKNFIKVGNYKKLENMKMNI